MAKNGAITISDFRLPSSVQAGQGYNAAMDITMKATQVPEDDPDRCSNSHACGGSNGYCIQPFVISPVDGVVKASACITAPSEGVKNVTIGFNLTAPDKDAQKQVWDIRGGFALPGTIDDNDSLNSVVTNFGGGANSGNPQADAMDMVSGKITVTGVGGSANIPPSVNGISVNQVPGGIRAEADVSDPNANITGFEWFWEVEVIDWRTVGGGNFSSSEWLTITYSGGNPTGVRFAFPESLGEGRGPNLMRVQLVVHDSSGRVGTASQQFSPNRQKLEGLDPVGDIAGEADAGVSLPGGGLDSNLLLAGLGLAGAIGAVSASDFGDGNGGSSKDRSQGKRREM